MRSTDITILIIIRLIQVTICHIRTVNISVYPINKFFTNCERFQKCTTFYKKTYLFFDFLRVLNIFCYALLYWFAHIIENWSCDVFKKGYFYTLYLVCTVLCSFVTLAPLYAFVNMRCRNSCVFVPDCRFAMVTSVRRHNSYVDDCVILS